MPIRRFPEALDAVLFDVDGTLVNSIRMIVRGLGDTIEHFAGERPSDEVLKSIIGTPLRQQLRRFFQEEPSEQLYQQMFSYTLDRFEANVHLESNFDAAVEALELFHKNGIKTAFVTSKDHVELAGFMRRFSAMSSVDCTVCASDVNQPKPAPESAFLAMKQLNAAPERTIIIGDSVFDLRCGRDAGIANAAVLYGAGQEQALLAEEPNYVFRTPEDLLEWAKEACNQTATQRETCPGPRS